MKHLFCKSKPSKNHRPSTQSEFQIALVGNPNCGKTTLFNQLTGAKQCVGNWPGVTVEKRSGRLEIDDHTVEVIDLPGVYTLSNSPSDGAIDERIAQQYILQDDANIIVNIIDACHLERSLYLTSQLLDMQVPLVIALNMTDLANKKSIKINPEKLSIKLGCPVVPLASHRGEGIEQLKKQLLSALQKPTVPHLPEYPKAIHEAIVALTNQLEGSHRYSIAIEALVNTHTAAHSIPQEQLSAVKNQLEKTFESDADIIIASARYDLAHQITEQTQNQTTAINYSVTEQLDSLFIHRILGIPLFLGIMYFMFFFAINITGAFQDVFDISSEAIFVHGTTALLQTMHSPDWLTALLAQGAGRGINTTLTFIPVIGGMFLFLSFLEGSGYMARATFVMDRFMNLLGLPGKSFIPLIVGFGCNVPAVMATRTLENPRDRILTILMSPFMSCGARLAIFAVFTAAFFPRGGHNVVFSLYLVGILAAIITGFVLRKTLLQGDPAPLVLELPNYHRPTIKNLFIHTWQRLKGFVIRAGRLILPVCILIGALNNLSYIDGQWHLQTGSHSILAWFGQRLTPLLSPMGISQDNWPATVGLLTGVLAKEVVIATLNTLYSQLDSAVTTVHSHTDLITILKDAWLSIPENLHSMYYALFHPLLASAPIEALDRSALGTMSHQFTSQTSVYAYLLFVLLYIPCVSTAAAIARELNYRWAMFSILWSTGLAYGIAVLYYQVMNYQAHPMSSLIWISGILFTFTTIPYWIPKGMVGA